MNDRNDRRAKVGELIMSFLRRVSVTGRTDRISGLLASYECAYLMQIAEDDHIGCFLGSAPACACGKKEAEGFVDLLKLAIPG